MSPAHDEEQQVAEFARQTRKRRVFFALSAAGLGALALVGAAFLFGGQLQTAQSARAGQAADELRRGFDAYRDKCAGTWRTIFGTDWAKVPEARSRPMAARLASGDLSCAEVAELARGLPQRPGMVLPAFPAATPSSVPASAPIQIRLGPGIRLGPPVPASAPASAPAR